ncbi:MAG: hypothetical protein ACK4Y4_10340 [Brevundimonas sp.]
MSFRANLAVGAAGIFLCLATAGAGQACSLSLQPSQDSWTIRYDPFAQDATQNQFDVAVVNQGDVRCSGTIRVDLSGEEYGLRMAGAPGRIPYALIDERDGADLTPRAGLNARRINAQPVALEPGERSLLRFTFVTAPGEVPAQGLHVQNARIALEDRSGVIVGERPLTLALDVVPAAVLGLKGEFQRSNGVARIDLGELTPGPKPLSAALYVMSTGGYRVSVGSANGGRLRMGATDWYVDYELEVGAHRMNLATPDGFEVVSRRARADDYPLSVRIGDVAGRRAGEYTDVITFTVAAL